MRKIVVFLMVLVMTVAAVACGSNTNGNKNDKKEEQNTVEIADALEILTKVWAAYAEDEKFPVGGGDSANISWEGPAWFDVAAVDELNASLGLPAELAEQIDDAASMMNSMMANNFTAGVYHLKDASEKENFTATLKDALLAKHWMCGFPEKVILVTVDDYVISAYGLTDNIETFQAKLTAEYPAAELVYKENIE